MSDQLYSSVCKEGDGPPTDIELAALKGGFLQVTLRSPMMPGGKAACFRASPERLSTILWDMLTAIEAK